jgi:hypothetical protein
MPKQLENARIEAYLAEVAKQLAVMQIAVLPKPLISVPKPRMDEELKEMRQHLLNAVSAHQENGQSKDKATANALADFGTPEVASANVLATWLMFIRKSGLKTFGTMVGIGLIVPIMQIMASPNAAATHTWLGVALITVVTWGLLWAFAHSLQTKAQRRLATVLQQG